MGWGGRLQDAPDPERTDIPVAKGLHHVGQAGLELLTSGDLPTLASHSAGVTGILGDVASEESQAPAVDICCRHFILNTCWDYRREPSYPANKVTFFPPELALEH
ncbi:Protein GVQW1 [Plecturocebus cupreus]